MVRRRSRDVPIGEERRGTPRLVATRANTQPAFGVYFARPQTEIARPHALLALTLEGLRISAITWFGGNGVFPDFGLSLTRGGVALPPTLSEASACFRPNGLPATCGCGAACRRCRICRYGGR